MKLGICLECAVYASFMTACNDGGEYVFLVSNVHLWLLFLWRKSGGTICLNFLKLTKALILLVGIDVKNGGRGGGRTQYPKGVKHLHNPFKIKQLRLSRLLVSCANYIRKYLQFT